METEDKSLELDSIFDLDLVKPASSGSSDDLVETLSESEKELVSRLQEILIFACNHNQLTTVYRGENKNNLERILGTGDGDTRLLDRLFYIGSKAKSYIREKGNKVPEEKRDYLRNINDISLQTYTHIFEQISRILNHEKKHIVVRKFIDEIENNQFVEFFQNTDNLDVFLSHFDRQSPINEKEKVRDYYLYLLHTFGRRGVGNKSFLVSSSKKKSSLKNLR